MPYQIGTTQPGLQAASAVFGYDPKTTYSPGGDLVATNAGTLQTVGFPRSVWSFASLSVSTYASIKSTYLSGAYSGEVYIETRDEDDVYKQWHALLRLPNPVNLSRWGGRYQDIALEFVLLEDVTP